MGFEVGMWAARGFAQFVYINFNFKIYFLSKPLW